MADQTVKAKPFLKIKMRCGCGSVLFVELPQESASSYLQEKLLHLATVWTGHHGHGPTLEKLVGAGIAKLTNGDPKP